MEKTITLNLREKQLKLIDEEAEKVGLNRSSFIRYILVQRLNAGKLPIDLLQKECQDPEAVWDAIIKNKQRGSTRD